MPAAIAQFDRWIGAMAAQESDRAAVRNRPGGFSPLIVGLHWPSRPWGDENVPAGGTALLSASGGDTSDDDDVDAWARRIADTPRARTRSRPSSTPRAARRARQQPSPALLAAYAALFAESGLDARGSAAAPGADQEGFDPAAIIAQSKAGDGALPPATKLLGIGDSLKGLFFRRSASSRSGR